MSITELNEFAIKHNFRIVVHRGNLCGYEVETDE